MNNVKVKITKPKDKTSNVKAIIEDEYGITFVGKEGCPHLFSMVGIDKTDGKRKILCLDCEDVKTLTKKQNEDWNKI